MKKVVRIANCATLLVIVLAVILSLLIRPEPIRQAEEQVQAWQEGVLPRQTASTYPVRRLADGRVAFAIFGYAPFGEDESFPFMQPGQRSFYGVPKRHQYIGYRTESASSIAGGRLHYYRSYSPIYTFWLELVDEAGKKIQFAPETYRIDVTLVNIHPGTFFPLEAQFGTLTALDRTELIISMVMTRFGVFKYCLIVGALLMIIDLVMTGRGMGASKSATNTSGQPSTSRSSEPASRPPQG